MRTLAIAVLAALACAGCADQHGASRLAPRVHMPYDATREALDLRALSSGQLLKLDRELRRCMAQVNGSGGIPAAVRFRACAFRELAHSSISQRFNAMLALTLTRRLHGGSCRESLLALAGVARIVATEAEALLRELNSTQHWDVHERREVRALRALARDTRHHLNPRAWRRDCRPAFNVPA